MLTGSLAPPTVYPSSLLLSVGLNKEGQCAEVQGLDSQIMQLLVHSAESPSPWPHILTTKKAPNQLCPILFCSLSHIQTLVCPILFLGIPACCTRLTFIRTHWWTSSVSTSKCIPGLVIRASGQADQREKMVGSGNHTAFIWMGYVECEQIGGKVSSCWRGRQKTDHRESEKADLLQWNENWKKHAKDKQLLSTGENQQECAVWGPSLFSRS